jgi:hypothetical protein
MKIVKVLQPFLKHAKQEQDNDTLEFETMRSIAEKTARARWQ